MPIYTRTGDAGETLISNNKKVPKDDIHIEACGQLDELNALLGLCIAFCENERINGLLTNIQADLFSIGAELSGATKPPSKITPKRVGDMEQIIDILEKDLPPLTHFILPGGSKTAALFHHARTVCRRAERRIVTLSKQEKINTTILIYLNRLSDLFFLLARWINKNKKQDEAQWSGGSVVFIPGLIHHPSFNFDNFSGF
jgi:cob(I)alamin adenosyltransferase